MIQAIRRIRLALVQGFYFIFNKSKRRWKMVLSALILIFFICAASAAVFLKIANQQTRATILRNNPVITKLLPVYWQLRKLSDIFYLPYYFKSSNVSTYELTIDGRSVKELNDALPDGFMDVLYTDKVWVPGEFRYDGRTYQVKVRYRGDNAVHWNAPKKSYAIEFDKDDLFNGISKLNFIIPFDRNLISEQFNNYRAQQLGLMAPYSGFANLKINGKNNGLYFIIEGWSKEMLAKWEVPDGSNFYSEVDPEQVEGVTRDYKLWDNMELWGNQVADDLFPHEHYTEVYQLLQLLNEADDETFYRQIFSLVDENSFYAWQIHQELVNSTHQAFYNVRLYFDDSSGKFHFIPWDVIGSPSELDQTGQYGSLAQRIFTNPSYLHEKNRRLYEYANNKEFLQRDLTYYDALYERVKLDFYKDRMKIYSNHFADKMVAENRELIIENVERIKDKFSAGLVFVNIGLKGENSQTFMGQNVLAAIDINVKASTDYYLEGIEAKLPENEMLSDYTIYYDVDGNQTLDSADRLLRDSKDVLIFSKRVEAEEPGLLEKEVTTHRFYIASNSISSRGFTWTVLDIKPVIRNAVTGKKLKKSEMTIKLVHLDAFSDFGAITDIDGFRAANPTFRIDSVRSEIILGPGNFDFRTKSIIPRGYTLKIMPGTNIRFGPGVSLVSYSPIVAKGTAQQPITFSNLTTEPWGVVAVQGVDGSEFSYTRFTRGKDDYVNGVYYSGMLSVYHGSAVIENAEFTDARADDGLNIKSARAEVKNSRFIANSSDAIDYDFIKSGEISSNQFFNNGNDAIDLSGSTVLIRDNTVFGSGDKCISIGEHAVGTVIYNNILKECNIGIEVKDRSDIAVFNNVIIGNNIGIRAYRKKPVFGGADVSIYNSILWENDVPVESDEFSNINIFSSNLQGLSSYDNGNFSEMPPFRNPSINDYSLLIERAGEQFLKGGNRDIIFEYLGQDLGDAPVGLMR